MTGAEEAALRKLLFALPGGGDGARAKALAGAIAAAAKLAASAPKAAGPEAARALGTRTPRIMVTHVLRNIMSPILVQATFIFAYAMLAEAGLSFLGVGVDPRIPTWGIMVNEGRRYIDTAFFLILFPGAAIALSVLSLQIVGDGLRDALDPRLAKET